MTYLTVHFNEAGITGFDEGRALASQLDEEEDQFLVGAAQQVTGRQLNLLVRLPAALLVETDHRRQFSLSIPSNHTSNYTSIRILPLFHDQIKQTVSHWPKNRSIPAPESQSFLLRSVSLPAASLSIVISFILSTYFLIYLFISKCLWQRWRWLSIPREFRTHSIPAIQFPALHDAPERDTVATHNIFHV